MPRSNKGKRRLNTSSESDNSNDDNKPGAIKRKSTSRRLSNNSKRVPKSGVLLNQIETVEDDETSIRREQSPEIAIISPTITISHHLITRNNNENEIDREQSNNNNDNESTVNEATNSTHINQHTSYTTSQDNDAIQQQNDMESTSTLLNTTIHLNNDSSTSYTQIAAITSYFSPGNDSFQRIVDLNENLINFQIRCKVISVSNVRRFASNRIIDGILCDTSGEIKIVAFNDEVDRIVEHMKLNEKIILENGEIILSNQKYRSPYSPYEIRLCPSTTIRKYEGPNFSPIIQINKKQLRDVPQLLHGIYIDVERTVILDRGVMISAGHDDTTNIHRRSFKIRDDTATINITIWNEKLHEVPDDIMNKNIRIRGGKTNHYNDYVSINVSQQSIIQFY